ncbi:MAG: DUF4942 domain-containing protein [Bradymonadia bacterium]
MNTPVGNQDGLVHGDLIRRTVQLREDALGRVEEALGLLERVKTLMGEAAELRAAATADLCGADHIDIKAWGRLFGLPGAETLESARRVIDAGCWSNLLEQSGFQKLMDHQARQEFAASLEGDTPPFELEHVEATVKGLLENSHDTYLRGVANAFSGLDRRFKSHDGFKFGRRIIFAGVFDESGYLNWRHPVLERLEDVCRIFALMNGDEIPEGSLVRGWLTEGRDAFHICQTTVDTPYFRLKTFKNGNCHLWLTEQDLVEQVNLCLAEFYGEVLGDAVPKGSPKISTALAKDLQFYATPQKVARELVRLLDGAPSRILEPSAGEGALLEALRDRFSDWHTEWRCDAYEVHEGRARTARLRMAADPRFKVQVANFLDVPTPSAGRLYDAVVMNPPFAGTHWMHHVRHAWSFLRPGGDLLAVLPISAQLSEAKANTEFRAWAKAECTRDGLRLWGREPMSFHDLEVGAFRSSGTNVSTCILHMEKPDSDRDTINW